MVVPGVPGSAADAQGAQVAAANSAASSGTLPPGGASSEGTGDAGDGEQTGAAKSTMLASLQDVIKARAAAPEKLKTTGVAFQAVEEVCPGARGSTR